MSTLVPLAIQPSQELNVGKISGSAPSTVDKSDASSNFRESFDKSMKGRGETRRSERVDSSDGSREASGKVSKESNGAAEAQPASSNKDYDSSEQNTSNIASSQTADSKNHEATSEVSATVDAEAPIEESSVRSRLFNETPEVFQGVLGLASSEGENTQTRSFGLSLGASPSVKADGVDTVGLANGEENGFLVNGDNALFGVMGLGVLGAKPGAGTFESVANPLGQQVLGAVPSNIQPGVSQKFTAEIQLAPGTESSSYELDGDVPADLKWKLSSSGKSNDATITQNNTLTSSSNLGDLRQGQSGNAWMALNGQVLENSVKTSAEGPALSVLETDDVNAVERSILGAGGLKPASFSASAARVTMPVSISFSQPGWASAVAERAAVMASQKVQFAEIQLDPPELGQLQVRVSVNQDQQASVTFVSPHAQVREALDQTANRLREMLSEQGVDLVDVNVSDQAEGEDENVSDEEFAGAGSTSEDDVLESDDKVSPHLVNATYGVDDFV